MTREELEKLYLVDHKTMEQIGSQYGVTRQRIWQLVHKYGLDVSKAERFDVICSVCGKSFQRTRKRYTKSIKHFCGAECYKAYLRNIEYRQNRTGQRRARIVVEKALGRYLRQGEVVHHEDGNDMNNELDNLKLFANHSEHLKHHHGLRRERLSSGL